MFSLLPREEDGQQDKQVKKKRRAEVLVVGSAEDEGAVRVVVVPEGELNDGANAEDERGEAEETCSEQARRKKKKKEKKKQKKMKKEREEHSGLVAETHEDDQAQAKDPLKQSPPMPLTDGCNAAHFIRQSQVILEEARGSNAGVFLDLCCGKGGVGKRAEAVHGQRSISVDWASEDPAIIKCDLTDPAIRIYMKTEIIDVSKKRGFPVAGMLHVPCETFSPARHGKPGGRAPVPLRDYTKNVWGLPGLPPRDQAKLEQGNKIARALLGTRDDLKNVGAPSAVENGDMSMLFKVPEMCAEDARVLKVCYCMMGRSFRKRTRLLVWNAPSPRVLEEEARRCATEFSCNSQKGVCRRTGEPHMLLRGWVRGKALTKRGEKYPKKFVNIIARILCSPSEQTGG